MNNNTYLLAYLLTNQLAIMAYSSLDVVNPELRNTTAAVLSFCLALQNKKYRIHDEAVADDGVCCHGDDDAYAGCGWVDC